MKKIQFQPLLGDATPTLRRLLKSCDRDVEITLEPAVYHFWPDQAHEQYCFISNNQHGLKRIAWTLADKENVTIRGNGAKLIFHGEIIPFLIERSTNIRIEGLTVDWVRPFYSQGVVRAASEECVEVEIDVEQYPHRVENNRIIFEGEGWESPLTEGVFAFDPSTRAPAFRSGDSLGLGFPKFITVESAGQGRVRLLERFPKLPRQNDRIVFRHYKRCCPGIFINRSQNVTLEHVTLHHAGAMGVIAQFSENLHLSNYSVTPSGDRLFSVAADATHFVNCRGEIRLENCLLENQLDDPLNVHGINARIQEVLGPRTLLLERVHHEQHGVSVGSPGDQVVFSDNANLLTYASNELASIEPVNARYVEVTLVEDLPPRIQPGHVMDNASWTADLVISGCTVRNNRARGFLISTPGKVLVEGNQIAAAGSAIKISGDANYWFESGAVRDVTIRRNTFGDCCYGAPPWGRSVISIDPEIEQEQLGEDCFHRNIRIEDNIFRTFDPALLFARSVEGLVFQRNQIVRTNTYPAGNPDEPVIRLEVCRKVDLDPALLGQTEDLPLSNINPEEAQAV